jgi:hypothetical protein
VGACSELVFAPIDEMFPDDAPLLPSGFRIIPLDSKSVEFICVKPELSYTISYFQWSYHFFIESMRNWTLHFYLQPNILL